MPTLLHLVLFYGVCFGMMYRVKALHGKHAYVDKLLSCSYCTGFHAGWMSYVLTTLAFGTELSWRMPIQAIAWGMVSAPVCYVLDICTQILESKVSKE